MDENKEKKYGPQMGDIPQIGDQVDEVEFRRRWTAVRKKKALRITLVLFILAGFTIGMYFVFYAFGFDLNPFLSREAREAQATDWQGGVAILALAFIGIYIAQSLTLNLIPGTTTFFIAIVARMSMFPDQNFFLVYGISVIAVLVASVCLYAFGRYGGRRLLYFLFDKESLDKRLDWFARNGSRGVPWLFLVPFFPTDLLCVTCGAAKMKFWHFILIVVVFRPIEVALLLSYPIILESGFVQETDPMLLILFVNVMIINAILLVIYHKALLGIFNKTFRVRKYQDDLAAAKATIAAMQAKQKEQEQVIDIDSGEEIPNDIIPIKKTRTKKPKSI
ncbi:MAG: VTT domain-containing protein [Firmicutes bacterium]|nr:VTT domain-containing protein [Bacillota bacterium]